MKTVLQILLICLLTIKGVSGQSNEDYNIDLGIIQMDSITVRQFIKELKITNEEIEAESKIKQESGAILVHRLYTNGQQDTNWICEKDLEYLMTLIDSEEPAKCIIRSISSSKSQPQRTTIGKQVILILYSYKEELNYPHKFSICGEDAHLYKQDIINWWKETK